VGEAKNQGGHVRHLHRKSGAVLFSTISRKDEELPIERRKPYRRDEPVFPSVPWQRCQFHLQQNAQAYVPRLDMRAGVAADIRSIFNCQDIASAQARLKSLVAAYAKSAPKLSAWMEENIPQGFAIFSLPTSHQLRMRTSNAIERVNQELKRSTRVASLFPNESSLLRLISALLCEISEEWLTGKIYLNMNPTGLPKN